MPSCYRDLVKEVSRVAEEEAPNSAAVPRQDSPTSRHAPPASEGLTAGASKQVHRDVRRQRQHPAKPGPLPEATTQQLIAAAVADMGETPAPDIAVAVGTSANGQLVRSTIRKAREAFAQNVESYVKIHHDAAAAALANGDPKSLAVAASAAEWALEHIGEGADRIIDSPKAAPTMPSLQIGIAVGGVPQKFVPAVSVLELPPLDAPAAELDVP